VGSAQAGSIILVCFVDAVISLANDEYCSVAVDAVIVKQYCPCLWRS
jgi:hypothetical protein